MKMSSAKAELIFIRVYINEIFCILLTDIIP